MSLRPYQQKLITDVESAWAGGARNVLMVLPTGGGKTVTFSDILRRHVGASAVIAHRQEIVSQISIALAREGVKHDVIAAEENRKSIIRAHLDLYGKPFIVEGSRCRVASVDTLIRRKGLETWAASVTKWVVDEGHHVVRDNKWARAIDLFTHPQCLGLLPTATPRRADGKGLGRHADGLADAMIEGPTARWLIENGFLTPYKVIVSDSHLTDYLGEVSASGDWSPDALRRASEESQIVGDVVRTYCEHAMGKLGITFTTDVVTAGKIAAAYRAAGVPAEVLTGDTDAAVRRSIIRQFERREILQIVAVDVVSEGFDLPAIEVGSLARPTASLAVYLQQVGRVLRLMEGKLFALLIDHSGNVLRHGAPDKAHVWSMDRRIAKRDKMIDDAAEEVRICSNKTCALPYEKFRSECPFCKTAAPEPAARNAPEMVEGVMRYLDDDILAALRGEVALVDMNPMEYIQHLAAKGAPAISLSQHARRQAERQEAQQALRTSMATWGGYQKARGLTDDEMQRLFWHSFGVDVVSAQALGTADAGALKAKVDYAVSLC